MKMQGAFASFMLSLVRMLQCCFFSK